MIRCDVGSATNIEYVTISESSGGTVVGEHGGEASQVSEDGLRSTGNHSVGAPPSEPD